MWDNEEYDVTVKPELEIFTAHEKGEEYDFVYFYGLVDNKGNLYTTDNYEFWSFQQKSPHLTTGWLEIIYVCEKGTGKVVLCDNENEVEVLYKDRNWTRSNTTILQLK